MHAVHVASIRGLCKRAYNEDEIEAWARSKRIAHYQPQPGRVLLVLEEGRTIFGVGILNLDAGKIEVLYLHPHRAGGGHGAKLLAALEAAAREHGMAEIDLDSSLNAEAFYTRHGYAATGRHSATLTEGVTLECVRMTRKL